MSLFRRSIVRSAPGSVSGSFPGPAPGLGPAAVLALLDEHEGPLLAYATRLLHGDRARGQDAVQEVFLRLCRQEGMNEPGRAWLFTTTRRVCIDILRKEARMETTGEVTGADRQVAAHAAGLAPDELVEQTEGRRRLARAVDQLPANQREAIRLKFDAGLSYAEIATVLGSTEGTVGWWLHAAVKSLRERLGDALGDETVASSIGGGEA